MRVIGAISNSGSARADDAGTNHHHPPIISQPRAATMAKKSQSKPGADGASNPPPHVPNRDLMQRMNFLYQASVCLQGSTGEQKSASSELQRIARKHVKTLKGIASGAVVKM